MFDVFNIPFTVVSIMLSGRCAIQAPDSTSSTPHAVVLIPHQDHHKVTRRMSESGAHAHTLAATCPCMQTRAS